MITTHPFMPREQDDKCGREVEPFSGSPTPGRQCGFGREEHARDPKREAPEDVYEAAARVLWSAIGPTPATYDDAEPISRDRYLHVAGRVVDAIWPAGVAAGRAQAAADIRAHADKHAPADGNFAQLRLRRHLDTAQRVALGPMTHAEVAQALNEMFAGGEPRG